MAQFETSAGIDGITGKFNKHTRLTMRQKQWHYPDGRVFGCGPKEVYSQEKRDNKCNPRLPPNCAANPNRPSASVSACSAISSARF